MIGLCKDIMIRVRRRIWLLMYFTWLCSGAMIHPFSGISECLASTEALSVALFFFSQSFVYKTLYLFQA